MVDPMLQVLLDFILNLAEYYQVLCTEFTRLHETLSRARRTALQLMQYLPPREAKILYLSLSIFLEIAQKPHQKMPLLTPRGRRQEPFSSWNFFQITTCRRQEHLTNARVQKMKITSSKREESLLVDGAMGCSEHNKVSKSRLQHSKVLS